MSTVLLYDADCGFCRACVGVVLAWDRRRRLRPVAIQSAEGERLLDDLTPERRLDSWHLVVEGPAARPPQTGEQSGIHAGDAAHSGSEATGGERRSAGAALAPLLRMLPGGAPFASLAGCLPAATERGYRWVAEHRGPIGRAVPSRVKRWADRRIAERGQATAAGGR